MSEQPAAPAAADLGEQGRAVRQAGPVSGFILLSRVLGLGRDILFAAVFPKPVRDAFILAYTVPNLFRRMFGEGALSAAFIPVFTDRLHREGPEAARRLAARVLTLLAGLLAAIVIGGELVLWFLPEIMSAWDPARADSEKLLLFSRLARLLLPYVFLVCLLALLGAVLNALRHFILPALAPALLNIFWLAGLAAGCLLLDGDEPRAAALALAILAGGVAQLLLQWPALKRHRVRLAPDLGGFRDPDVRRIAGLMLPALLGLVVIQVNVLVDRVIAETMVPGHGAVSALFYGDRLMQFPLALIGIALATTVFPLFASHEARGEKEKLADALGNSFRLVLFLAIPAGVGLILIRGPLVGCLFEYGEFDANETARTARVLACYGIGLGFFCGYHIVVRAFYALKANRVPVITGAAMVALNLGLNLLLVRTPLREAGLALATTITAAVNLALLLALLARRLDGSFKGVELLKSVAGAAGASLVMVLGCLGAWSLLGLLWSGAIGPGDVIAHWLGQDPLPALPAAGPWLLLGTTLVAGPACFLLGAALLRTAELRLLWRLLWKNE